jgi:hypothetical protein
MQNPTDNQAEICRSDGCLHGYRRYGNEAVVPTAQSLHLRQAGNQNHPENQFPMMTADRSRVAGPPRQLLVGTVKNPKVARHTSEQCK